MSAPTPDAEVPAAPVAAASAKVPTSIGNPPTVPEVKALTEVNVRCRCDLGGLDTGRGNSRVLELMPCQHRLHEKCYSAFVPATQGAVASPMRWQIRCPECRRKVEDSRVIEDGVF
jgi:hypothetical protein